MVEIAAISGLARLILRGDTAVANIAGAVFGVAIPCVASRGVASRGIASRGIASRAEVAPPRAALWLGPDEFLLLLPRDDLAGSHAALIAALAPHPHALVDISHRQLALRVAGENVATLLNTGCPLDLDPAAFPVNACTRTLLGKAEIVLWRVAENAFHLEVARSYLPYVRDFLAEALHGVTSPQAPRLSP